MEGESGQNGKTEVASEEEEGEASEGARVGAGYRTSSNMIVAASLTSLCLLSAHAAAVSLQL